MRDAVLDNLSGLGTGKLRDSYDAVVAGGAKIYVSGMSANSRGLSAADIEGKPAQFAMPNVLVRLAVEHDRIFTYQVSDEQSACRYPSTTYHPGGSKWQKSFVVEM